MKNTTILFILFSISLSAQIKGVVKDSISGQPIAFVNISVENENIGATSEENGEFLINTKENKNLIFSALGYKRKVVKAANNLFVKLTQEEVQLDEVVIAKKYETKEIEIGKTPNATYQAFENGPKLDTKFFPYLPKYKKTKFIKKVSLFTDSKIESATVKVHFYAVDANGFQGEKLLKKDLIVTVKSGIKKFLINVSDYNLKMPKTGIFVGCEKLLIEKNKLEKTIIDANTNTKKTTTTYFPLLLYNPVERDFLFSFSGGKWIKQSKTDEITGEKKRANEPAITLILTN